MDLRVRVHHRPTERLAHALAFALAAISPSCARGAEPCAAPGGCGTGFECIANRCAPVGADPVPSQSERIVVEPAAMAYVTARGIGEHGSPPATVTFGGAGDGDAALFLRFDQAWLRFGRIDSAFLVLRPEPGTHVDSRDVEVSVWRIRSPWNAASVSWRQQPELAPPRARGIARSSPPSALRIDVTDLVQHAWEHQRSTHGIALKAKATSTHGATFATGALGTRAPMLEVYGLARRRR